MSPDRCRQFRETASGLALIAGCAVLSLGSACTTKRGVSISVLVDMSSSVSAETQQFYLTAIGDNILAGMQTKDVLEVRPIDSSSEQRSEALYSLDLTRQNFADKRDGVAKRDEKVRERVRRFIAGERPKLEEALRRSFERRKAFSNQTDIIGALMGMGSQQGDDKERPRAVVVFSDMIQESSELDIKRYADERQEAAARMVDALQKRGRVPRLSGSTVVVVGAGDGATTNAAAFRAVHAFWQEFFARAGATLAEGDYGYRTQQRVSDAIGRLRQ